MSVQRNISKYNWNILDEGEPTSSLTEYKNQFRVFDSSRRQPIKPDNEYKPSTVPIDSETVTKSHFIPHNITRIQRHQPEQYKPPEGKMDTLTVYSNEFIKKQTERAPLIRHDVTRKEQAKFEGNPIYKSDYRQWDLPRTKPIHRDSSYVPSNDLFGGDSIYVQDYKHYEQSETVKPIRPDRSIFQSSDPFIDRTGYKDDFVRHELPAKFLRHKEEYKPNKNQFESMSITKLDFTFKDAEKTRSYKPENMGFKSEGPFEDDTNYKNDFKKWDLTTNLVKKSNEWKPPKGEMSTETVYNTHFTPKIGSRVLAGRPSSRKRTEGKFEDETIYSQDFRRWENERRAPLRNQDEYLGSNAAFEGLSTYKEHFFPKTGGPSQSYKPIGLAFKSDQPFEGISTYRTEFAVASNK